MTISAGSAVVDFDGRFDGLTREVNSRVGGMKSTFSSAFKGIAAAAGGIFAGTKIVSFFGDSIDEAREAAKVTGLTNAVIKSTGGIADITADQVGNLANKLSLVAGVDDELVQAGENVLLTFTNVRNGVGKGNDIFNQATAAAVDLSAALGTDLQGSVIQIGKALNDPIKGVTALQRVGVSFTAQQKDQIKTLVESGRTLDAQKIILKELQTEFGGAAAAVASPADKFKVAWANVKESVGTAILPLLNGLLSWLAVRMPGAVDKAGKVLGPFFGGLKQIFTVLFKRDFVGGGPFAEDSPFIAGLFTLRDKVFPFLQQLATWLQANWKTALIAAGAALLLLIGPVAAIIAAFAFLYLRFQVVRDVVGAVVAFIGERLRAFVGFVQEVFPQVQEAIGHFVAVVMAGWRLFGDDILRVVTGAFTIVRTVVQTALDLIANVIRLVLAVINGDWGKAWDALKGIVGNVFGLIRGVISGAFDIIRGIFGGALDGLGRIVSTGLDKVVGFFSGLGKRIGGAASGMWDGIKDAFKSALNWIIGKWNGLEFKLPEINTHIPGIGKVGGFTLGTPDIPKLHTGGTFHAGTSGGEGLAFLRDGELVETPEQQNEILQLLREMASRPVVLEADKQVIAELVSAAQSDYAGARS